MSLIGDAESDCFASIFKMILWNKKIRRIARVAIWRQGQSWQAYPASRTRPRLTLSPSPGRSDQNVSDDRIVRAPKVRNA